MTPPLGLTPAQWQQAQAEAATYPQPGAHEITAVTACMPAPGGAEAA